MAAVFMHSELYLFRLRDGRVARIPGAEGREQDVLLPPYHSARKPRCATGVEDVQIVG